MFPFILLLNLYCPNTSDIPSYFEKQADNVEVFRERFGSEENEIVERTMTTTTTSMIKLKETYEYNRSNK